MIKRLALEHITSDKLANAEAGRILLFEQRG